MGFLSSSFGGSNTNLKAPTFKLIQNGGDDGYPTGYAAYHDTYGPFGSVIPDPVSMYIQSAGIFQLQGLFLIWNGSYYINHFDFVGSPNIYNAYNSLIKIQLKTGSNTYIVSGNNCASGWNYSTDRYYRQQIYGVNPSPPSGQQALLPFVGYPYGTIWDVTLFLN